MHQAGRLVKDIFNELEAELPEDFLRSTIVGVSRVSALVIRSADFDLSGSAMKRWPIF